MSRKARLTHRRIIARVLTKGDEMTSDDDDVDNWLENAVAADSVGKSEVELRDQRADIFAGLVTALAVDVAKELTVLSAMDIEIIDPALHVETMTALLEADELVTCLLLAIDEVKRQVAKNSEHPAAARDRQANGKRQKASLH